MNKTPAEWRTLWSDKRTRIACIKDGLLMERVIVATVKVLQVEKANALLGYAMARGWFNV